MASLSHDIILDILCLLEVKDLVRFRCVSKPFCSSIDDPDFIKVHLSRSLKTNDNRVLVIRSIETNNPSPNSRVCDLYSVSFDSLNNFQKLYHPLDVSDEGKFIEIFGSCNGLLALFNGKEISLWNPSTRKSRTLPLAQTETAPRDSKLKSLVYGLGYDPISDDYKLVRVVQFESFDSEVKVYSLRTNFWRRIKDFPFYLKYKRASGILANNALHWVVSKTPELSSQGFVVALDLKIEEYRVVELPDCLGNTFHMNVKAVGGCLCLIANYLETHIVDIWIMKEYGVKQSWTKLISLKQSESLPGFIGGQPLAFSKNGDKVLLMINEKKVMGYRMTSERENKLMWYDIRSKRVDEIRIEGVSSRFWVELLVESLVPLNGNVQ